MNTTTTTPGHHLIRVWNQGEAANFTYAFRCECGHMEGDYLTESYARDGHSEHSE